jgi:hypothetical protein
VTILQWGGFVGGLLIVGGGPMWAGRVRPGLLWGVRTSLAFESEENWYRLNRPAGRVVTAWGVVHLVLAAVLAAVVGPDTVLDEDGEGLLLLIPTLGMLGHLLRRVSVDSIRLSEEQHESRITMHG